MPKVDSYGQGVEYPALSDAPNIETAFQTAVNKLVPLGVMRFTDANARAATLVGSFAPRPGMVTYLVAEDRWEARASNNKWVPLTAGPWIPLTFASGYTAHSGSPGYRLINGTVQLRGAITRTSSSAHLVKGDPTLFATLPAGSRPVVTEYLSAAVGSTTAPAGRLDVFTNGEMRYLVSSTATNDVDMFSLSGTSFSVL